MTLFPHIFGTFFCRYSFKYPIKNSKKFTYYFSYHYLEKSPILKFQFQYRPTLMSMPMSRTWTRTWKRILQQKSGNHWRPLGFFSWKLTDTESHYSTFDCELLAAHAAIKHFRHFCEGRQFQLRIDHKPLLSALTCVSVSISPRQ